MKITIGKFDNETGTVPVAFAHAGVTHRRTVNACRTATGTYDKAATAERVDEVALGVEHKIALGLLVEPPAPEPATDDASTGA